MTTKVAASGGHNSLSYNPGAAWWSDVSKFLTSHQGKKDQKTPQARPLAPYTPI